MPKSETILPLPADFVTDRVISICGDDHGNGERTVYGRIRVLRMGSLRSSRDITFRGSKRTWKTGGEIQMPTEEEKRLHRCCFSGHRPEKLEGPEEQIKAWLETQIRAAISAGFITFISGCAMGVDIWAGQIVIRIRR